eukprot:TRINITY_DN286_c0_g4_i9.p1 TRINITY_DN286_c0_g4~~TRINITY_DN286_c0_g4_i9.p1  ORF type:complete len:468 (+),score=181.51 TRINITY_DN286_c0_g4_i9:34-1437(+)
MLKVFAFFALIALALGLTKKEVTDTLGSVDGNDHIHVVIVAGSDTWGNYRHQADAYHAYQSVVEHGIPTENIIVMHTDDIANNRRNPLKGYVRNYPSRDAPNVYEGVPKHYTGNDVTPANFLSVLVGNATRSGGPVLETTKDDRVFVFFVDHGGPGILAFPNEYLHAADLINALNEMHAKNMYKQLVFYVEACFAGSMFKDLRDDIDIYVTTAANPNQSSFVCYEDSQLGTYLGDFYDIAWIENTDKVDTTSETLQEQYELITHWVNASMICQYGDLSIAQQPVSDFMGSKQAKTFPTTNLAAPKEVIPAREAERNTFIGHLISEGVSAKAAEAVVAQQEKYINNLFTKVQSVLSNQHPILSLPEPPCKKKCDTSCMCYEYCEYRHVFGMCEKLCCSDTLEGCHVFNAGLDHPTCSKDLINAITKTCGLKYNLHIAERLDRLVTLCVEPAVNGLTFKQMTDVIAPLC